MLRPVFGVQISHIHTTKFYSFVAFLDNGNELTYRKILTTDDFVKIASGHWPSIYNPTRTNLFEQHQIGCGMFKDSLLLDPIPYCFPVDSLWKIRYSDFPFNVSTERGWSNDYNKPSRRQAKYLAEHYLVNDVNRDYFLDTNLWNILRDVRDPEWIKNYKDLK
jgi:hypothetical protein